MSIAAPVCWCDSTIRKNNLNLAHTGNVCDSEWSLFVYIYSFTNDTTSVKIDYFLLQVKRGKKNTKENNRTKNWQWVGEKLRSSPGQRSGAVSQLGIQNGLPSCTCVWMWMSATGGREERPQVCLLARVSTRSWHTLPHAAHPRGLPRGRA